MRFGYREHILHSISCDFVETFATSALYRLMTYVITGSLREHIREKKQSMTIHEQKFNRNREEIDTGYNQVVNVEWTLSALNRNIPNTRIFMALTK